VAFDPLPSLGEREFIALVSTGRRHFVRHLLGEVTALPERNKPSGRITERSDPIRLGRGRMRLTHSVVLQ
jgi:hypothetical protein